MAARLDPHRQPPAWFFASAGPCFYNQFVGHDPSYAELARHLAAL
ncbi:hypothetical protein [Sphingomonas ginkgonis]|nr:hypothetical protein [Sphingomonas ginkgonis]